MGMAWPCVNILLDKIESGGGKMSAVLYEEET